MYQKSAVGVCFCVFQFSKSNIMKFCNSEGSCSVEGTLDEKVMNLFASLHSTPPLAVETNTGNFTY